MWVWFSRGSLVHFALASTEAAQLLENLAVILITNPWFQNSGMVCLPLVI
jgi:hypothetical protein